MTKMGPVLSLLMMIGVIGLGIRVLSEPLLLYPDFYEEVCPEALPTIQRVVYEAVQEEKRMGASLLRLHFHDCFVNGCDGSILLDSTPEFVSEKLAAPNINSVRGFEVIDRIKSEVDKACGGPVVSCADILAVAARDSVVALGGVSWEVPLGRRDSTYANISTANSDLPAPFLDLEGLMRSFEKQGLGLNDLVVLSGGHTLGFAHCLNFRPRIYNHTNIDPDFQRRLQALCPQNDGSGDDNLSPLDPTPASFDANYFRNIVARRGLLHSDQALFSMPQTKNLVLVYSLSAPAFATDFAASMIKMGSIRPLTGAQGQIRYNCSKPNN